jgi:hypothetical protein
VNHHIRFVDNHNIGRLTYSNLFYFPNIVVLKSFVFVYLQFDASDLHYIVDFAEFDFRQLYYIFGLLPDHILHTHAYQAPVLLLTSRCRAQLFQLTKLFSFSFSVFNLLASSGRALFCHLRYVALYPNCQEKAGSSCRVSISPRARATKSTGFSSAGGLSVIMARCAS